jgi:hypothetical protein
MSTDGVNHYSMSIGAASPGPRPDDSSISDFENPEDATYVRWKHAGDSVYKQYADVVHAVVLASQKGVVIVEPYHKHPNNAVIYKADGTPWVQLINPLSSKGSICFMYPYYVGSELTLAAAFPDVQYSCVFDENGRCLRTYEVR